jgi:O-antigen/teichoic acid export membrane protein
VADESPGFSMFSIRNQSNSLATRAFWLLAAKTVAYAISFALPLILVRRLDQSAFGLYKQAFLIVNTAVVLLPVGFMMSAYYFLPREPAERQGSVVVNILVFYYALGFLVFLTLTAWPGLLKVFLGAENGAALAPYAPLIGLTILFWVGSSFLEVISVANQEAHLATVFIVNAQTTKTGFLIVAALSFSSVRSLLWAAILQGLAQALILQIYLHSRFRGYWRSFDWRLLGRQLAYALPLGAAAILQFSMLDLHNYFVGHFYNAADYAIYSLGGFTMPLVGIIATSVSAVLIPRISQLQTQGETREILETILRAMRKLAALYFPIYVFFLVAGREVILVMFREAYLGTWPILLVSITIIPFLALVGDPVIRAFAEHRFFMLKVRVVELAALFFALWWSTVKFGMHGTIVVAVAFLILDRVIEAARAWTIVGIRWRDAALLRDWIKIGAAAALAGVASQLVHHWITLPKAWQELLLCGAIYALVYAALLLAFNTLTPQERHDLARLRQRARAFWRGENSLGESSS